MKKQIQLIDLLFEDLMKNVKKYAEGKKDDWGWSLAWMNKDFGKTALKRKITFLRQELLNLEKMIDQQQ